MKQSQNVFRLAAPEADSDKAAFKVVENLRDGRVNVQPDLLTDLSKKGSIDERWVDDLVALKDINPDASVTFLEPFEQRHLHLFGSIGNGLTLEVSQSGQVEFKRHVALSMFVGEMLGPFHAPLAAPSPQLDIDLSAPAFAAFAGATDVVRRMLLASLISNEPLIGLGFKKKDLSDEFKRLPDSADNRRLCVIAAMLGANRALAKSLPKGLSEIADKGLTAALAKPKGSYVPLPALLDLTSRFANPAPAFVLKPGAAGEKSGVAPGYALVGGWSLLRIAARGTTGEENFNVKAVDGNEVIGELVEYLALCCGMEKADGMERDVEAGAGKTDSKKSRKKEPAKQAKPAQEPEAAAPKQAAEPKFCTSCGTPRTNNAKFCTSCGAKAA